MSALGIDWAGMTGRTEVWSHEDAAGTFSLVFLGKKLWLVHENGMGDGHAIELDGMALHLIADILDSYDEWRCSL